MAPLPRELRRLLENVIIAARDAAEDAARAALRALSVDREEAHSGISDEDRALRVALRARARQLGDFDLLVAEVAYEQWHRMLFARFLAENDLLMHPSGVAVSLAECADLAPGEGEADEWMLAARYASEMLPGIFRLDDPCVRVRFARNDTAILEKSLTDLPSDAFTADDSLGWVYQFWQSKRKREVNDSERKIAGADLPPVTQLFTEHYMVRCLLDNSLGAWWYGKHADSPLLQDFEFLRFDETGEPAAGAFASWPSAAAQLKVMDPSCGSGHFLISAFEIIRKMREAEEGLSPAEAADAALRDNIYGLELDGRCVQIAVFALAMAAWKIGGYRALPQMNIACSGVPARGDAAEWRRLAGDNAPLADALQRLRALFKEADSLGSLLDPKRVAEEGGLFSVSYDDVEPLLHKALARFGGEDPAQKVLTQAVEDVATAARLLAGSYTLVATNPPYLGRRKQAALLCDYLESRQNAARHDLAVAFLDRWTAASPSGTGVAMVLPDAWFSQTTYKSFRHAYLRAATLRYVAALGEEGFEYFGNRGPRVVLFIAEVGQSNGEALFLDASTAPGKSQVSISEKLDILVRSPGHRVAQAVHQRRPNERISGAIESDTPLLRTVAKSHKGMSASDKPRFVREFWEADSSDPAWEKWVSPPETTVAYGGRSEMVFFEGGEGDLRAMNAQQTPDRKRDLQGRHAWGKRGIAVSLMRSLSATLYDGEKFDATVAVLIPKNPSHLGALAAAALSGQLQEAVREMDTALSLPPGTLELVPFDVDHWMQVFASEYPTGLPPVESNDPTQWVFGGDIASSRAPLQVAVARLLGFRWPDQADDQLDRFADADGIVCLPPVDGERSAADRLRELLAAAYGPLWSESLLGELLAREAAADLTCWLRDAFFSAHAKLFHGRPFIWHVWDGRTDGFAVLLNYHSLNKLTLEKVTFRTLQWWIDRQRAEVGSDVGGAEARLAAALELQGRLVSILNGERPYDVYVRWKPLHLQPIGWEPDVNDGVRLNIRPFVTANILRAGFNINWKKDRGTDPDGTERMNNLHYTIAEKLAARGEA